MNWAGKALHPKRFRLVEKRSGDSQESSVTDQTKKNNKRRVNLPGDLLCLDPDRDPGLDPPFDPFDGEGLRDPFFDEARSSFFFGLGLLLFGEPFLCLSFSSFLPFLGLPGEEALPSFLDPFLTLDDPGFVSFEVVLCVFVSETGVTGKSGGF